MWFPNEENYQMLGDEQIFQQKSDARGACPESFNKCVGLDKFRPKASNVNDERNCLLLFQSIERAFDCMKLGLMYDHFASILHLKIECPDLKSSFVVADEQMRETFHKTREFSDIDNAILMFTQWYLSLSTFIQLT